MEMENPEGDFLAAFGRQHPQEPAFVYTMLKSSDVASGQTTPRRWMLVPQRTTGEATNRIRRQAPVTWAYLEANGTALDARKSSIYRNHPRFSIFGIGDYAFAPWKVAISGLYKKLVFSVLAPHKGRPVMLDDTVYLIPCQTETEAKLVAALLNSPVAAGFFGAFIFWDSKRPITVDVLRRLDIRCLAQECGQLAEFDAVRQGEQINQQAQLALF